MRSLPGLAAAFLGALALSAAPADARPMARPTWVPPAPVPPVRPVRRAWTRSTRQSTLYAVVVHPSTRTTDVSMAQLRRIFLGDQQFWPNGARVVLFVQAPGGDDGARTVALRTIFRMSEAAFKRYWIEKTFRDDVASGPKIVSTPAMARRLTATIPGAVALIPAAEVDGTVKVLRVDGRVPGDDGYALTGP